MKKDFKIPRDKKRALKKKKWTKDQFQRCEANKNVMNIFYYALPKEILLKIGEYKDARHLWEKIVNLHKNPSSVQKEE